MNSLEARFVLEACRKSDLDASDPKIAEALRVMESDPRLAEWFAASQEFDRVVAARLETVAAPADLALRIRAGRCESDRLKRWRVSRSWLAAAAAVVLLGTIAGLFIAGARTGDLVAFRADMADFMDRRWDHTFDVSHPDFESIRQWLESQPGSVRVALPRGLATNRTLGCKTLKWKGNRAALICFMARDGGTVVHVLTVHRDALKTWPGAQPQFANLENWNSAVWSCGDQVYLLLTPGNAAEFSGCL